MCIFSLLTRTRTDKDSEKLCLAERQMARFFSVTLVKLCPVFSVVIVHDLDVESGETPCSAEGFTVCL